MALAQIRDMPTLRIKYETDGLLPAAGVAIMLSEVAKGFERHVKRTRRYSGLRLAIARIEVSSLSVDLVVMALSAGKAIVENREALTSFVGFLADILSIAKGLKPGKLKAADNKMIEVLQAPVAEAGAQQVNLFVVGDGNTVNIDRDAIRLIASQRERNIYRTDYELDGPHLIPDNAAPRAATPRLLRLEGQFGTILDVRGQWYVRLEGEGGVLNPVRLSRGVQVRDGYRFDTLDGFFDLTRRVPVQVAA